MSIFLPALNIPDIDLPKAPITHAKARTVPTGFLRNASDTNNGAADARNCSDPINPFRLTGFSKNLINPSIADPARNDDICNRNLPTLFKVLASLCIESGFLANQVNAANPAVALNKNPENLTRPENNPPNDFLVLSPNCFLIFLNKDGCPISEAFSASFLFSN